MDSAQGSRSSSAATTPAQRELVGCGLGVPPALRRRSLLVMITTASVVLLVLLRRLLQLLHRQRWMRREHLLGHGCSVRSGLDSDASLLAETPPLSPHPGIKQKEKENPISTTQKLIS